LNAVVFRFLEHTADLAVEIAAPTVEELFTEAAAALTACLVDGAAVASQEERRVTLRATDLDRLLVAWLGEALAACDIDGWLVGRAEATIERAEAGYVLRGSLWGEPADASRHPLQVLIKGVSYHGLRVESEAGGWRARVVFDI
jgi:SHS2 domain-containing protein